MTDRTTLAAKAKRLADVFAERVFRSSQLRHAYAERDALHAAIDALAQAPGAPAEPSDEQILSAAASTLPAWLRHHPELDADDLVKFARAVLCGQRSFLLVTKDWMRRKIAADPDREPEAGTPLGRFFIDHGMIHDRVTGQHVHAMDDVEAGATQRLFDLLNELFYAAPSASAEPVATAFTYDSQPDNVGAWRLGEACRKAADSSAGDYIDRGLVLLRELQAKAALDEALDLISKSGESPEDQATAAGLVLFELLRHLDDAPIEQEQKK